MRADKHHSYILRRAHLPIQPSLVQHNMKRHNSLQPVPQNVEVLASDHISLHSGNSELMSAVDQKVPDTSKFLIPVNCGARAFSTRARGDQDGFGAKATGYPPLSVNFEADSSRTTSDSH
ncbi:hypothetical protein D9619_004596 [Psilocybe cf. subviscida]|uniref:Uncharacterized protein n=1 Tax=Psilocybe cf. subviscida TaxID=2480587 RepID=A0A8H5BRG8_9AGAR|nr:hypothetical protein D9619_004596 [Psilocybe cf. subviscida]